MCRYRLKAIFTAFCISILTFAQKDFQWSENYGKSMAVFGGSFSVMKESNVAKDYWIKKLNLKISNYGVSGAGFSNLTKAKNIQYQVDIACAEDKPLYDIYLLWASTNDFVKANAHIGSADDFTQVDGYDTTKLKTQCGGINYCIKKIYEKNPKAKILFLTSIRCFKKPNSGTNPFYKGTNGMNAFVKAQIECCERWGIPYLNQFLEVPFNEYNYKSFIKTDNLHLNEEGYNAIKHLQAVFIAKH